MALVSLTQAEVDKLRNERVIKANQFIQKTRYNLTTRQQKILMFVISKISKHDTKETKYHTTLSEVADVCNIPIHGGSDWTAIDEDLTTLADRKKGYTADGQKGTISFLGDYKRDDNGNITYWFNENTADYLFALHEQFTRYNLIDILVLKSKYSIRLYELLRSYAGQHRLEHELEYDIEYTPVILSFKVEYLRELLDTTNDYAKWYDFSRYVLKKAVNEINGYNTEIHVDMVYIKHKKIVQDVQFTIIAKAPGAVQTVPEIHKINREYVDAYNNQQERLGTGRRIGSKKTD